MYLYSKAPLDAFRKSATRHPDAYKHDMKGFINRPIPRLLRYELLLKEILGQTPLHHDDRSSIPEVIELISSLARETQPGVESAKQKVELWKYHSNLIFKTGEAVVCLSAIKPLHHADTMTDRIWIFWMTTGPSCTPESF